MKRVTLAVIATVMTVLCAGAQGRSGENSVSGRLFSLQQRFVDLKFGMFIHFNMPTFWNADWPDPDADKDIFNPAGMDCSQWARAARSAKMTYGCLTTKHHSGFCQVIDFLRSALFEVVSMALTPFAVAFRKGS